MEEQTSVTLMVGILGFIGVMITLRYNGKLAREQREDERNHERDNLRSALIEELEISRTALRENVDKLREDPPEEGGGAYVPIDPMDDVYRSLVSKIGLLSQAEVSTVINAYLSIRTHKANLFLISVPDDRVPQHFKIPGENVDALAGMQENLIDPIDRALDALSQSGDG